MGSDASAECLLDRAGIEGLIPHRAPFLFVDRIVSSDDTTLVSEWDVAPESFFFEGHYPGNPILPGVILNEFVFQSAAVFMSLPKEGVSALPGVPVLTRIEDARFKQIVRPGETVRAEVTLTDRLGPACYMKAKVTSNGKVCVRLSFVVAMAAAEEKA